MQRQPNSKIVGATIIGFALVGGAFTISSLQAPKQPIIQAAAVSSATALRVPIPVTDTSGDGIEDWREEFITTNTLVTERGLSDYTLPETLTGQMSITFLEDVIRSRGHGPFGRSEGEVIQNTINELGKTTTYKIYDTPDIIIMQNWDDADIRNYANTVASVVYRHSIPNMDGELEILYDLVSTDSPERYQELLNLVEVYRGYRDDTLKIPVPAFLAKEHLDLINTYHAIFEDIVGMSMYADDPVVTLVRLKRYEDDATGLAYAFQNISLALDPYADFFSVDDPALLFVLFHPDFQI